MVGVADRDVGITELGEGNAERDGDCVGVGFMGGWLWAVAVPLRRDRHSAVRMVWSCMLMWEYIRYEVCSWLWLETGCKDLVKIKIKLKNDSQALSLEKRSF
jgi:hypothetical protein